MSLEGLIKHECYLISGLVYPIVVKYECTIFITSIWFYEMFEKTGHQSQIGMHLRQEDFQDRGMERSGRDGKQMVKFANIWRNTYWQV